MCVAMPGTVIALENDIATVDFSGSTVKARCGLVPVHLHDRVLVHAGCILQVLTEQDHQALTSLFAELEEL